VWSGENRVKNYVELVNKKYSNESKKIVAAAKGTNNLFFL
jgi:hypothetical protein